MRRRKAGQAKENLWILKELKILHESEGNSKMVKYLKESEKRLKNMIIFENI